LAFLVSVAVFFGVAEFWEAIAAVLAGGAILAGAAWAAFQGDGRTPGGGRLGKTALIAAAIPGAVIVAAYAVVMVASLVPGTGGVAGSYHRLAINGKIYKVDTSSDGSSRVADLKGNPLNGADGKPVGSREFNRLSSGALGVTVDFGQGEASPPKYRSVERYFSVKNAARGELWYYWPRYGRIFEFDAKSRRARGSLGPDGFVAGEALPAPAPLFAGRTDPNAGIPQINYATLRDVLATPDAVYEIIFSKCQIWPLFHADPGDSVGGLVRSAFTPDDRPFDVDIVTKSRIYCVNSEGPVLWSTPYQPAYPDYNQIGIHERFLPGSELKAVVWFKPSAVARKKSGGILPDHLVWIGGNATALKAENLPDLPQPDVPVPGLSTGLVAPPAVLLIGSDVLGRDAMATLPASMTCAAVFAVAGWVVARRRNFGLGARVAWAVFHLAFGLPGFLVCLAGMENIAREKCPRCGKLRVVTRKNCEHCGAGFAPPELDGTEILEFPGLAR
jgi:hypothetical protein